MYITMFYCFV